MTAKSESTIAPVAFSMKTVNHSLLTSVVNSRRASTYLNDAGERQYDGSILVSRALTLKTGFCICFNREVFWFRIIFLSFCPSSSNDDNCNSIRVDDSGDGDDGGHGDDGVNDGSGGDEGARNHVRGRINRKKNNTQLVTWMVCCAIPSFFFVPLLSLLFFYLSHFLDNNLLWLLERVDE